MNQIYYIRTNLCEIYNSGGDLMDRRSFLKNSTVGVGATAAAATLAAPAYAQGKRTLTMAVSYTHLTLPTICSV